MKKGIVLALLMVYGLASFGVSLNYFYCCGNLETVSLSITDVQEAADHCPMGDKNGCCENKTVNHKISVDQTAQLTLFYSFLQSAPAVLPVPFFLARENTLFATLTPPAYKKPPPVLPDTDIVFLSVFRI